MFIDPERLEARLGEEFGGSAEERRVVVRQAVDLADAGRYRDDTGYTLTTDIVVSELADAPEGTPADRWNWWIGSLEIAYGGYGRFRIDRYSAT
ncbi:hypothetical protein CHINAEXTREME_06300 [Halobiforma lacisalsi AJ5]|uniref:Uncharacterized protein n=1 Tax=Natronobacterium lacisalsi AJ5 TaxID=358396 RepID=M0LXX2_NATLA|nr:hypothetical protein [Halobiforma lacisalsi]APW97404.1 hypothetical protein CHINAEXTREME_06300 [Halobiforma lacisalsi AJ5]EMA38301.1 hypothetical protein C445_00330 [Halobiforma lacisalsi AJ5]